MKPIIVKVSKDKNGCEFITLTLAEFEAAIDGAYDAGYVDSRREQEMLTAVLNKPLEVLENDD